MMTICNLKAPPELVVWNCICDQNSQSFNYVISQDFCFQSTLTSSCFFYDQGNVLLILNIQD